MAGRRHESSGELWGGILRITGMVTRVLALDAQPWYGESRIPDDVPPVWNFPLTCVTTDEGIDGWTMGYGANGEGVGSAYQLHDVYLRAILGHDPCNTGALWQRLMSLNRHLYPISDGLLGMLDVAFWDIKGKAAGVPIGELLGVCRTRVPAYRTGSHWNVTPEQTFAEAARTRQAGYRGYKLTLYDGPAADIPRLRAARDAVGEDFPLMLDAVGEYCFEQALQVGEALAEAGYHWFEEPVPDRHIAVLQRLRQRLHVPVLATETVSLRELPQFLERQAIDIARGDVFIKAGITGLRKALDMCGRAGINLEIHALHSSLLDIANLHVACSVRNCDFFELHHPMFRFALHDRPLDIDGSGHVHLPTGPGLGVELDWDWIDDHTVLMLSGVIDYSPFTHHRSSRRRI